MFWLFVWVNLLIQMWNNCECTPLEPGWEGHVTLEFSNTTPLLQDLC